MDTLTVAMLTAQRENLRALLLLLPSIPDDRRGEVKAGAVQALGAIEDALNVPRTFAPREERRRERLTARV